MEHYTIQLNYSASFVAEVDAEDEGQALDKAREMAESADIRQYNIFGERETQILNRQSIEG